MFSLVLRSRSMQEDYQEDEAIDINKHKEQETFHLLVYFITPYPMSHPSPKYGEDTTSTISIELI